MSCKCAKRIDGRRCPISLGRVQRRCTRIELFNRWLKNRRPLPARAALRSLPTRASLVAGRGSAYSKGRAATVPPCRTPPAHRSEAARLTKNAQTRIKTPAPACAGAYSVHDDWDDIWIFGYGSILWRQGFAFERSIMATSGATWGTWPTRNIAAPARVRAAPSARAGTRQRPVLGLRVLATDKDAARILETRAYENPHMKKVSAYMGGPPTTCPSSETSSPTSAPLSI